MRKLRPAPSRVTSKIVLAAMDATHGSVRHSSRQIMYELVRFVKYRRLKLLAGLFFQIDPCRLRPFNRVGSGIGIAVYAYDVNRFWGDT